MQKSNLENVYYSVRLSRKLSNGEISDLIHILYSLNIENLLEYKGKFKVKKSKTIKKVRKISIPLEVKQLLISLDINIRLLIEDLIIQKSRK